jgi:hypothetical protein
MIWAALVCKLVIVLVFAMTSSVGCDSEYIQISGGVLTNKQGSLTA